MRSGRRRSAARASLSLMAEIRVGTPDRDSGARVGMTGLGAGGGADGLLEARPAPGQEPRSACVGAFPSRLPPRLPLSDLRVDQARK